MLIWLRDITQSCSNAWITENMGTAPVSHMEGYSVSKDIYIYLSTRCAHFYEEVQEMWPFCEDISKFLLRFINKEHLWEHFYCPPMKLRESNVCVCVCPSFSQPVRGSHVIITHDALRLTVKTSPAPAPLYMGPQGPRAPVGPLGHGNLRTPLPASVIWWPSLETCSCLVTSGILSPNQYSQYKRAVVCISAICQYA